MKTLFTLVQVLAFTFLFAKHKTVTIDKAYKTGVASIKIKGTGTYRGNCLRINIKNNGDDSLFVLLEAGRRLDSKNNGEQDILVTKEQLYKLEPRQKKSSLFMVFAVRLLIMRQVKIHFLVLEKWQTQILFL